LVLCFGCLVEWLGDLVELLRDLVESCILLPTVAMELEAFPRTVFLTNWRSSWTFDATMAWTSTNKRKGNSTFLVNIELFWFVLSLTLWTLTWPRGMRVTDWNQSFQIISKKINEERCLVLILTEIDMLVKWQKVTHYTSYTSPRAVPW